MRLALMACAAVLLVASCSTGPRLPQFQTKPGDRVGILVDIGETPSHVHIGTTVSLDFEKDYPYHWNLSADVKDAVRNAFSSAGYSVVDLRGEGFSYRDLENLVVRDSATWKIAPDKEAIARRLTERLGVKVVVVVKQAKSVVEIECPKADCTYHVVYGPGLYTRSFLGFTNYSAVAAFKWNVFVLNPPADTAAVDPLASELQVSRVRLEDFPHPSDFRNIGAAEFVPVHDAIVHFVEKEAVRAARTVAGDG